MASLSCMKQQLQVPRFQRRVQPRTLSLCRATWKKDMAYEDSTDVRRVVEEVSASSHGLMNDAFKSVLAGAIERQGPSALLQGQEKLHDEYQSNAQEEVLQAAIMASKSSLLKLQMMRSEVEKAIKIEEKQVERLMFALNKARSDAAYYRTVQNMMNDGANSD